MFRMFRHPQPHGEIEIAGAARCLFLPTSGGTSRVAVSRSDKMLHHLRTIN